MKFNDLLLPRNNSFVVIEDYASFVLLGQRGVDSSCFRTPGVAIDVYRLRILMRQTVDGWGNVESVKEIKEIRILCLALKQYVYVTRLEIALYNLQRG